MKMKKFIAILSAFSMIVASSSVLAATSFKDATPNVTASVNKIAAGETITIDYDYDTLVDSNGGAIVFYYDSTAFTPVEGTQAIKVGKKTYDFENYVSQTALDAIGDETHILYNMFGTFGWSTQKDYKGNGSIEQDCIASVNAEIVDVITFVYGDQDYAVTADDEADDMYPVNTVGINLVANDNIKPGTYTIVASSYANNKAMEIVDYPVKTFTITVEGNEPPAPTYTKYDVSESSDSNKGKEGSTDKHYSYGIMTTITPNDWTLNALDYKFTKDGGKTYVSSKDNDALIGWSTPFAGESVLTFAVNVVNIPNDVVVAGLFEYDWIDPAAKQ